MIFGMVVTVFGILLRALAEIKLEGNFSHIIRQEKSSSHQLVTTGIYRYFRHPSYTGWYYYLIGREIILHNGISFVITAVLFWIVLQARIKWVL